MHSVIPTHAPARPGAPLVLAALALGAALAVSGCSSHVTQPSPAPGASSRAYNGTASVGDFVTIAVDAAAHTIHYDNHSNGDTATVRYTVNPDGTFALDDPTGNLVAAYEVPNFALLIEAAKTGPSHDQASLVTAVQASPISVASISSHDYNTMQFRTAAGGVEVGSVHIDGAGLVHNSSYWPYGALGSSGAFHNGDVGTNAFEEDSSGTFMRLPDGGGGFDYVFGTPNGMFAVDTQNGAILGLSKAASKAFDPAWAGTYAAIDYRKTGATTGMGNVESGTASLGHGTLAVTAAGVVTISDGSGTLATGTLTPVADTAWLQGTGHLTDPCHGLFTLRIATGGTHQDVFCAFLNGAVLFSSFTTATPLAQSNPYDYFYGCAVR